MVPKRTAALAAAVGVLALAGCGADDAPDRDEAERVVRQFAEADGPEACELLTPRALRKVYAGERPKRGYERCLRSSERFEGGEIEISDTSVRDGEAATVRANTADDDRSYRVAVRKLAGTWLIDDIALVSE